MYDLASRSFVRSFYRKKKPVQTIYHIIILEKESYIIEKMWQKAVVSPMNHGFTGD